MRKLLSVIVLVLLASSIIGCSASDDKSGMKLADVLQAFKDGGLKTEPIDKPVPETVGAIDGFIFYQDNTPVKVYEYASAKKLKEAESIYPASKNFPRKGRFLLASEQPDAIRIFNYLK